MIGQFRRICSKSSSTKFSISNIALQEQIMRNISFKNIYCKYGESSDPSPWRGRQSPCLPTQRPGFDSRRGQEFKFLSWDWVCPLSVLSPAEALTCRPHLQGGPPLCICLVFWSKDCCSPYRHLIHGHFHSKSRGCKSYIGGGLINEQEEESSGGSNFFAPITIVGYSAKVYMNKTV